MVRHRKKVSHFYWWRSKAVSSDRLDTLKKSVTLSVTGKIRLCSAVFLEKQFCQDKSQSLLCYSVDFAEETLRISVEKHKVTDFSNFGATGKRGRQNWGLSRSGKEPLEREGIFSACRKFCKPP